MNDVGERRRGGVSRRPRLESRRLKPPLQMMEPLPPDFEVIERLARSRRATRHFRPDPIPAGLLDRLVDLARWAPSGYNLQPTHFVIVTDAAVRARLCPACMGQQQVCEAPALVIFTGDRRVAANHFESMLAMENEAGCATPEYVAALRAVVPLAFGHGPAGIGWLWKAALVPLARLFRPLPSIPAVEKRFWLAKQVMLTAMTFMLAAEAGGLSTLPMEGFDEGRVRKILGIPRSHIVPVIVAVGYPTPLPSKKTRLPIEKVVHREKW
jgi:nitroreductase